jgi:hypothetical protein
MGFAACEKEIDEIRLSGVYVLPTGDMTELHLAAFLTLSRKFVVDNIVKTGLAGEYRVYGREGQTGGQRYVFRAENVDLYPPAEVSTGCRDTSLGAKSGAKGRKPKPKQKTQTS